MLDRIIKKTSTPTEEATPLDVFGAPLFVMSDGSTAPFVVGVQHVPPGYGVPPHIHDVDDEFFYILEGEITLVSPEGESKAGAGACVHLPHDKPHGFCNASDAPARMLIVLSPGAQALEMFRHFDRAGRVAQLQPEQIAAIAGEYGVRFA
jgi:uncharacterized cupin superfamily protein